MAFVFLCNVAFDTSARVPSGVLETTHFQEKEGRGEILITKEKDPGFTLW